jgi:hypothetical protein
MAAKVEKKLECSTIAMQILQESVVLERKKMVWRWKNGVNNKK